MIPVLRVSTLLLFIPLLAGGQASQKDPREAFLEWKFGMFLHFNMATFTDREWANGYEDPAVFAPDQLDCDQWAEAARAAGMGYAVLTVKHTGGWSLWDSLYTESHDTTAFVNFRDGKADIVRDFVEACRRHGLKVGLYYCFPGNYVGRLGNDPLAPGQKDLHGLPPEAGDDFTGFIKNQLGELLRRYGPIDLLWIDQYRNEATWPDWMEILAHVKALQPEILVIANNGRDPAVTDILSYEYPWMKIKDPDNALPPEDNTLPAEVCDTLSADWFWKAGRDQAGMKEAGEVVRMLRTANARKANYLLNVAPDPSGRIPDYAVDRLREIGRLLREP